jgi:signal peptidase I
LSKVKSSLINNFKALFWALIIAGVIRTFAIEPFKIPSGSMKPNLLVGDFLFVSKWDYGYSRYSFPFGLPPFKGKIFESNPERGDIIVFKLPGQENINYVKRLVGLPGETIKVVNGKIYLKTKNSTDFKVLDQVEDGFFYDDQYGKEIQQFIENEYRILNITNDGPLDYTPEYEIPKDKFFFMGDNRDNSSDSRILSGVGFVPKVNIVGKVWFIWFSVDTDFSLSKFWNLPFHIRYDRLFNIIK